MNENVSLSVAESCTILDNYPPRHRSQYEEVVEYDQKSQGNADTAIYCSCQNGKILQLQLHQYFTSRAQIPTTITLHYEVGKVPAMAKTPPPSKSSSKPNSLSGGHPTKPGSQGSPVSPSKVTKPSGSSKKPSSGDYKPEDGDPEKNDNHTHTDNDNHKHDPANPGSGSTAPPSSPANNQPPHEDTLGEIEKNPGGAFSGFIKRCRSRLAHKSANDNIKRHQIEAFEVLGDEGLLLSISSVTEPVNDHLVHTQQSCISVISTGAYCDAKFPGSPQEVRALRPRGLFVVPWVYNMKNTTYESMQGMSKDEMETQYEKLDQKGHTFLAVLSVLVDPNSPLSLPVLRWLDSSPAYLDNQRPAILNEIRAFANRLQWFYGPGISLPIPFLPDESMPVVRQTDKTSCGIHTILNAWALALGLLPAPDRKPPLPLSFYKQATELINLALAGCVDLYAIYSFLRASAFVRLDRPISRIMNLGMGGWTMHMESYVTLMYHYSTLLDAENIALTMVQSATNSNTTGTGAGPSHMGSSSPAQTVPYSQGELQGLLHSLELPVDEDMNTKFHDALGKLLNAGLIHFTRTGPSTPTQPSKPPLSEEEQKMADELEANGIDLQSPNNPHMIRSLYLTWQEHVSQEQKTGQQGEDGHEQANGEEAPAEEGAQGSSRNEKGNGKEKEDYNLQVNRVELPPFPMKTVLKQLSKPVRRRTRPSVKRTSNRIK